MADRFKPLQAAVDNGLKVLGIRNFLLGIHDAAFPSLPSEDTGRGSPYSDGAAGFLNFARTLGFNGLQLGPQGLTTPANPSPYDSTFFSRNPLSLAMRPLTRSPWNLLDPAELTEITRRLPHGPTRVDESQARQAIQRLQGSINKRFREMSSAEAELSHGFEVFRQQHRSWLERDALYEILRQQYDGHSWKRWGQGEDARLDKHLFNPPPNRRSQAKERFAAMKRRHEETIRDYCFQQFLLAEQHRQLRKNCQSLGLKLFGDCQIGLSGRDAWYAQPFLLPGYVMGAPPSRTNPDGQPWNYPVFDPDGYYEDRVNGGRQPGPAIDFFRQRLEKLFDEFDGLRIDHPHGLVCPWVYRADREDRIAAVQHGARLFASPDLADHPLLARYAIVRPDQLNTRVHRYDDNWVADLDPDQVHRYAALFDVIMATAQRRKRSTGAIACEILSTQPYPIKKVMELYGLGRFRVTQKADLDNGLDVYRSENAQPQDWLMLGNHDTPTIWEVAEKWQEKGISRQQAQYLAMRLAIPAKERTQWAEHLAADAGALVQAKFADLFVGPAENIMVFFTDLLGIRQTYNRPGTVDEGNWSLRIDPDYEKLYVDRALRRRALLIPQALAMAIRARGRAFSYQHRHLINELEQY